MNPSGKSYFLVINGKPQGPFTVEQLKGFAIKPGDFVKTPGMDDYKEAHELEELRQIFHFAKRTVMPQYFAGPDQRLLAAALDWLIVAGIFIVPAFLAVLLIADREIRIVIAVIAFTVIPLANFIYHVVMESSDKQATQGKQIVKIKVCDMEGNRISVGTAVNRNFCKLFCVLSFFIGYLISFFNKKQQCMHDIMAGTLVVKDRLI